MVKFEEVRAGDVLVCNRADGYCFHDGDTITVVEGPEKFGCTLLLPCRNSNGNPSEFHSLKEELNHKMRWTWVLGPW